MALISFEEADSIGNRFIDLLNRLDIQPPSTISFEDELLSLTQLIEVAKNPTLVSGTNQIITLRAAAGVHDFAAKILSVETLPEFETFVPHLRLIAESKILTSSFSQNVKSGYNDDTARKMAELYLGCLAAHLGTDVFLDHPTNSKGDNPDVIFTVEEDSGDSSPETWALAIKTISSKSGQTIFERIKEGASQIDDPKCTADYGIVVINTKNALDHDTLWENTFPDLKCAIAALREQICALAENANVDRDQLEWDNIFADKVARPVIFLGQSLVRIDTIVGKQTPTSLKMFVHYNANKEPDPKAYGLSSGLNHFMQTILHGYPGTTEYQPC